MTTSLKNFLLEQKIEIVFANEFTSHLILLSGSLVLPLHYQNSFCGCIFCNTSNQYFQGSFRRPFDRITEYLLERKNIQSSASIDLGPIWICEDDAPELSYKSLQIKFVFLRHIFHLGSLAKNISQ